MSKGIFLRSGIGEWGDGWVKINEDCFGWYVEIGWMMWVEDIGMVKMKIREGFDERRGMDEWVVSCIVEKVFDVMDRYDEYKNGDDVE